MNNINNLINMFSNLKQGELTVLFGAGVSVNSGLPTVIDFIREILNILNLDKKDFKFIILGNNNIAIPFESFIEICLDNSLDSRILDIFKYGTPNNNHQFIRQLLTSSIANDIYTTNFDCMLEKELESNGLKIDEDFSVTYDENDFKTINYSSNIKPFNLYKIHGCISDVSSVRATLKSISNKHLSNRRQIVIKNLFGGTKYKLLLIIGYSCSDYFDITPEIQAIKNSNLTIIYIQHSHSINDINLCKIENINSKSDNNPFIHFNGYKIYVNTNTFISWISKKLNFTLNASNNNHTDWISVIRKWKSFFTTEHISYTILGQIFYRSSNSNKSLYYYNKALDINIQNKDVKREATILTNMGLIYNDLCNYKNAIIFHKKALKLFMKCNYIYGVAAAYSNLGFSYAYIDQDQCLENCNNALQLSNTYQFNDIKSNALNNLGLMHKNNKEFDQSIHHYLLSLNEDEQTGDLFGKSITLKNIGNIYYLKNDLRRSEQYYLDALDLSINIGYKLNEAEILRNLSILFKDLKKYVKSTDYYNKYEKIIIQYKFILNSL